MMLKARSTIHLKIMLFESSGPLFSQVCVWVILRWFCLSSAVSGGSGAETAGRRSGNTSEVLQKALEENNNFSKMAEGEADPEDGTNQGKP